MASPLGNNDKSNQARLEDLRLREIETRKNQTKIIGTLPPAEKRTAIIGILKDAIFKTTSP